MLFFLNNYKLKFDFFIFGGGIVMKLAYKAFFATLLLLTLVFSAAAQNLRSAKDTRNTTSTVGTGGPVGGPTGLFTVYDGQTLRKGEFTISAAYSNYDRDPGDVDLTKWPVSFQIGVTDNFELFVNVGTYQRTKVNSPANLSSFYLPNSLLNINGVATSGPAIVLAPQGSSVGPFQGLAVFRPTGTAPFVSFPFMGGNAGTFGIPLPFFSGNFFGFNNNGNALLGPPIGGSGRGAASFPGVGSVFGSILPGVVLSTVQLTTLAGAPAGTAPTVFTTAPSYLPDAPFINTGFGKSSINDFEVGAKIRFNNVNKAVGYGVVAFYRWNVDKATSLGGFSQLQQGSGTGGNRGDIGAIFFVDARLAWWANLSANIGLVHNSSVQANFPSGRFTILDRGDELQTSVAADFPVNKHFQWIVEFRDLHYVGGRTPNAFEQNPMDLIGGLRFYPQRWWGIGVAYRRNMNQQNKDFFSNNSRTQTTLVPCRPGTVCNPQTISNTSNGVPAGFRTSDDANGLIAQVWVGRRDKRQDSIPRAFANVDALDTSASTISLPCRPGYRSRSGACNDAKTVNVTTRASQADNDVLVYNYTVSGGRIVGTGANVQWDLGGAQAGTYTITAGVDNGCGICGKTQTKTVTVQECPDCEQMCSCPTLSVSGPSGITRPGDTMTFTANVSGGTGNYTYNWTVSAGTIESGQGTPSITVRTSREMAGNNVTASFVLSGTDPACNCPSTGSETGGVTPLDKATQIDEFGAQKDDQIKARVDNFYIQLNNNPNAQGYIINYGTPAQIKARRAQIMKAITFRKYDASRVTFVDGPDKGSGIDTVFWLVPPGADKPLP